MNAKIPIITDKEETLYKNYIKTKPVAPISKHDFILAHCQFTKESYPLSSDFARNAVVTYMKIHKHTSFDGTAKDKCLICNPKEPKAKKRK